jgi:endonuclease/exonuclease/phosphatase (EEP) superfamily protein YafD
MKDRLKWERDESGLRAEFEDGFATIVRDTSTGGWRWRVKIGEAQGSDIVNSKQNASNAANDAMPRLRTIAAQLAANEAHKAAVLAKIDSVTTEADPDVHSIFAIAAADRENLSWIMDQVRHRTRTPGLNKLIDALSRELYKFRTKERR